MRSGVVVSCVVLVGCGGSSVVPDGAVDGPPDVIVDSPPDVPTDGPPELGACSPLMALPIATDGVPTGVAIADLDGDGKRDLLVTIAGRMFPSVEPAALDVMRGNGDGTFQPAVRTVIDASGQLAPVSPVLADIDGDGDRDVILALANAADSAVQIVTNDGAGAFALGPRLPGAFVTSIGVGDLDGNGALDLVTASLGVTSGLAIHLGSGGGTFAVPVALDAGSAYDTVLVADVDGDQLLDLVAAGGAPSSFGELAVFGGQGSGAFDAPIKTSTVSTYGTQVVAGDLDGDGAVDLVTAGWIADGEALAVESWLGAGTTTFTHHDQLVRLPDVASDLPHPNEFRGFRGVPVLGDLDGDGKLDVVVTFQNRAVIGVIAGTGTGDLASFTEFGVVADAEIGPLALALGDLDGDSRLDAVVPDESRHLEILLGSATSTFRAPRGLPSSLTNVGIPLYVTVGDIDGDGKLDFATGAFSYDFNIFVAGVYVVRSSVVEPPRFYGPPRDPDIGNPENDRVRFVDLDGDGDLDLVLAANRTQQGWLSIFFNDGSGLFGPGIDTLIDAPIDLAVGDLDGDGKPELVLVTLPGGTDPSVTTVYINDGTGTFTAQPAFASQGNALLADLNRDSKLDLVTWRAVAAVTVQLGNGDGTFGAPIDTATPTVVQHLAIVDVDGDGTLDLGADTLALLGNGDGTFDDGGALPAAPGGLLGLTDLDGMPPIDVVGTTGAIYRAGTATTADEWTFRGYELRDVTGNARPEVIGIVPSANTAFVLTSSCP